MRWFFLILLAAIEPVLRADVADAIEDAKKFELPAGFKIEVVAAEPMVMNPVAFSMNERGQIYIAETYRLDNAVLDITKNTNWLRDDLSFRYVQERAKFLPGAFGTNAYMLTNKTEKLRMLVDTNNDGISDQSVWVRGGFRSAASGLAAGVLARGNKVWFSCVPDLYRFENIDVPNQGRTRLLSTGYGVHIGITGHDLHGLALGMDGKLYFSMGDRGFNVKTLSGELSYPDTGGVLRCNLDGSELEVVATGMRNPQELTFDELGNLWTADNDTAGEDKSRLLHVIEGGDYGWRCSYQHAKGFGPWVQEKLWEGHLDGVLPSCGEPAQGPSGFAYYPGSGLPAEFNGRFLLCDFPGGIQSFTVEPKGASYIIKDKKHFLWNAWPTDVEFGTDGGLYFSDWVGGWSLPNKGRIYRITNQDELAKAKSASTLAAFDSNIDDLDPDGLLKLLEHHDLRVRQSAHIALARKRDTAPALKGLAADASKPRAPRMHAIWALKIQGALAPDVAGKLQEDPDLEIRANAVTASPLPIIIKGLADESPRVRLLAAQGLYKKLLFDPGTSVATDALLEMVEKNADADPYLTTAAARVLTISSTSMQRARKHASVSVRRAAMLAERSMAVPGIANYLRDPALRYEAARAINDVPIPRAYPELGAMLTNGCPPEILFRAINANFRGGGPQAAKRLAWLASSTNWPSNARAEALQCLADWQEPDELDRVMGLWWPLKPDITKRNGDFALKALQPYIAALLQEKEPAIALAALKCVQELSIADQATNVLALYRTPERSSEIRAGALQTLSELGDANYPGTLEAALQDPALRVGAMSLVATNADAAVLARIVEMAAREKDVTAARAAYAVVRRVASTNFIETLKNEIARLGKKEIAPELALDLMETARKFPELNDAVDAAAKTAFDDPATDPLLAGGDAAEGRRVFEERTDVACIRCHAIHNNGGSVGPSLDGIAGRLSKTNILESILLPNKEIAEGYDIMAVRLKNGRVYVGKIKEQTTIDFLLDSPEDGPVRVLRNNIRDASHIQSAMPEGLGDVLGPLDLRNLVEYLSTLK